MAEDFYGRDPKETDRAEQPTENQDRGTVNNNDNRDQKQYSFWAEQVSSQSEQRMNQQPTNPNQVNDQKQQMNLQNPYRNSNESYFEQRGNTYNQQQSNNHGYNRNEYNQQQSNNYGYYRTDDDNQQSMNSMPSERKHGGPFNFIIKALCGGLIAGATFLGVNAAANIGNAGDNRGILGIGEGNRNQSIASTTVLEDAVVPDTDITKVYKDTLKTVVAIDCTINQTYSWFGQNYNQESTGSGSGFIVGKTDTELLIATNNHVVNGANVIKVTFIDGTTADAITKGTDSSADLAVISIDISTLKKDTLSAIGIAKLGDSNKVKEGEMAIAIGNALGYGQSITVGYISAVNREVTFDTGKMVLLQTDTAINPGNSGGALMNSKGEVIGINTAKLSQDSIEGICYAIPISNATPIIKELMSREIIKEEDQGYLGVYIKDITEEISKTYNMPMGVYVTEFTEDSAAKKAGILPYDIITGIGDVEISSSSALKEKINSYKYDSKITITLQRSIDGKYQEMKVEVTLGKKPKDGSSESVQQSKEPDMNPEQTNPSDNNEEPKIEEKQPNVVPGNPENGLPNNNGEEPDDFFDFFFGDNFGD